MVVWELLLGMVEENTIGKDLQIYIINGHFKCLFLQVLIKPLCKTNLQALETPKYI